MLVILKHGTCNYQGKRFEANDELDISERFYDQHQSRFDVVETKKEITNVEPAPKTKRKKSK
jgi:hypothetical protein